MTRVAFIGLGKMGAGMASRLLDAGHELSVYNRTAAKADSLVTHGARLASSAKEACAGAGAVLCMVSDDVASRAIWVGDDGILTSQLAPEALAIECSTLSHGWVMDLAARASDRGLRYIDSPVTGLPADAAAGALAVQIASAAEGMALAKRAGLDLATVADAVATGQAASPQVVRNVRRIVSGNHDQNVVFTATLRLKDVEYALALAQAIKVGAPFGELAASGLRELSATGGGQINESAIYDIAVRRSARSD
jgi:3-hydroxyisobutyrate dehydrogenase